MTEETTRQVLPTTTGFSARRTIVALRKHKIAVTHYCDVPACPNATSIISRIAFLQMRRASC